VVDAAGGRLYVDGIQKRSRSWTGVAGSPSTPQEIRLGHYPGGSFLPGTADELRIYDRALTAAEARQLYQ
jgi:concanavalin A-like lectin/glucanase superfamily protein